MRLTEDILFDNLLVKRSYKQFFDVIKNFLMSYLPQIFYDN